MNRLEKTEKYDRFADRKVPEVSYIVEWWQHGTDPWKIYYRQKIKSYKPAIEIFQAKRRQEIYDVNMRMIFANGGSVLVQSFVGDYPDE